MYFNLFFVLIFWLLAFMLETINDVIHFRWRKDRDMIRKTKESRFWNWFILSRMDLKKRWPLFSFLWDGFHATKWIYQILYFFAIVVAGNFWNIFPIMAIVFGFFGFIIVKMVTVLISENRK